MTAKTYNVEAVTAFLPAHAQIEGNRNAVFANAKTLEAADNTSIIWIASSKADKQKIAETTKATVIVCDSTIALNADILKEKCLIKVDNPRLAFTRIVNELYREEKRSGIHPSTVVSPEADIHPDCYIGPLSYIGKCTIGEGSIIHGRCYLYDGVVIGKNVIIHAGAVIGADGFGYSKNENGEPEKFPHIGGVIIEDDVEIGANTCIDKGALGNTIVKKGAKIDNLVHVAHNVVVGENSLVVALSLIGGSTVIGRDSWIAPSAIIRDGVSIGSKVTVGMGALVTKSIPDGETWAGSPARPLPEYLELQKKLKGL